MPEYTPKVADNLSFGTAGPAPRALTTKGAQAVPATNENLGNAAYDRHASTYDRWSTARSAYSLLETQTFFDVLGSVRGASILDLAAGAGRSSRMLMERGARSVLGADISKEMVRLAAEANETEEGEKVFPQLHYCQLDARDPTFRLEEPVDIVTAMYLLHYAPTLDDLERMARLIARNLKPGGRFVTYTLNPAYDFAHEDPRLMDQFGFTIKPVDPPKLHLVIGDMTVNMWQWSREAHESALSRAGLTGVRWHALSLPNTELGSPFSAEWYVANPHCVVLSAERVK